MKEKRLYDITETAQHYRVSESFLRRGAQYGSIPHYKPSHNIMRFDWDHLDELWFKPAQGLDLPSVP